MKTRRIEERNKRLNEEAGKMEVWHSMSYHNHFDGYAEYYEPGGGRRRIRRVYVGEYYEQKLSLMKRVLVRLLYIGLFLAGVSAAVFSACIPVASNCVWYVNIPQALTLPCAFYGLLTLVSYVAMPPRIKRSQYRFAVGGLPRAMCLAGCCCLMSAAAASVFAVLGGESFRGLTGQSILLFLAAGVLLLLICLIERRISYDKLKNTEEAPMGSVLL